MKNSSKCVVVLAGLGLSLAASANNSSTGIPRSPGVTIIEGPSIARARVSRPGFLRPGTTTPTSGGNPGIAPIAKSIITPTISVGVNIVEK